MSDCCNTACSTSGPASKYRCPVNGKEYNSVSRKTLLHHIKAPWLWAGKAQSYFFCDDPECDVVYFGRDDTVIRKADIRTAVGVKEQSDNALVCYCFGVTASQAAKDPAARAFVINETREHVCECEARNPSGKCCVKDFPRPSDAR